MGNGGPQWDDFPSAVHPHIDLVAGISARLTMTFTARNGNVGIIDMLGMNHFRGLRNDPSRLRESTAVLDRFTDEAIDDSRYSWVRFFTESHPRRALGLSRDRRKIAKQWPDFLHDQTEFSLALGADTPDEAIRAAQRIGKHNRLHPNGSQHIALSSADPANLTTLVILERAGFSEADIQLYFLIRETSGHVSSGFDIEDGLKIRLDDLATQLGNVDWANLENAERLFFDAFGRQLRDELPRIAEYFLHTNDRPPKLAIIAGYAEQQIRDPLTGLYLATTFDALRSEDHISTKVLYHHTHLAGIAYAAARELQQRHQTTIHDRLRQRVDASAFPDRNPLAGITRTPTVAERFPNLIIDPAIPRSPAFQRLAQLTGTGRFLIAARFDAEHAVMPQFLNEFKVDKIISNRHHGQTVPYSWATRSVESAIFEAMSATTSTHFGNSPVTATTMQSGLVFASLHIDKAVVEQSRNEGMTAKVAIIELTDEFKPDKRTRFGWHRSPIGHRIIATEEIRWDDIAHVLPLLVEPMSTADAYERLENTSPQEAATFVFDPDSETSAHPNNWRPIRKDVITEDPLPDIEHAWVFEPNMPA